jgi:hypothetical protein
LALYQIENAPVEIFSVLFYTYMENGDVPRRILQAYPAILLVISLSALSCSKEDEPRQSPPKLLVKNDAPMPLVRDSNLYATYVLSGSRSLTDLFAKIGPKKKQIVFKLNRRDLAHLREGDTLITPNASDNEMDYAPFPMSMASVPAKIIFIDRRIQAFAAYDSGRLVHWGPTSTGKKSTPTPEGFDHTNWRSKETHSTVNQAWVLKWYFNLDNREGISLHEYELPGYPASHSCVRLLADDAEWIYNWAEQWKLSADRSKVEATGTPVIVYNTYEYGKKQPWKQVIQHPASVTVSDSLLAITATHWLATDSTIASVQ